MKKLQAVSIRAVIVVLAVLLTISMLMPVSIFAAPEGTGAANSSGNGKKDASSAKGSTSSNNRTGSTGQTGKTGSEDRTGSAANSGTEQGGWNTFYFPVQTSASEISITFTDDFRSSLNMYPKLATYYNGIEEQNAASFLVDAGDFSMGDPYHTVYSTKAPELNVMKSVGYDAVGVGGSELAQGISGLASMIRQSGAEGVSAGYSDTAVVASNIERKGSLKKNTEKYKILEEGGRSIAVFSLVTEDAVKDAGGQLEKLSDPISSARETVKKIKKKDPDLIVCLYSRGKSSEDNWSQEEKLASEVKGINLIVSSGSGIPTKKVKKEGKTRIVSAGGSKWAGNIIYTQKDQKMVYDSYKLTQLRKEMSDDPTVAYQADQYIGCYNSGYFEKYGFEYGEKLAESNLTFSRKVSDYSDDPYGALIADAYLDAALRHKVDADASVVSSDSLGKDVLGKGKIKTKHVFDLFSSGIGADDATGTGLIRVYLAGDKFRALVEQGISEKAGSERLFFSGIKCSYNRHRFGSKIYGLSIVSGKGKKVETQKLADESSYCIIMDLPTLETLKENYGDTWKALTDEKGRSLGDKEGIPLKKTKKREIKQWSAISAYIRSIGSDGLNGGYAGTVSTIEYRDTYNPTSLFAESGKAVGVLISIAAIIICGILLLILFLRRRSSDFSFTRGGKHKTRYPSRQKQKPIFSNRGRRNRFK